jgi:hypothetical protein
LKGISEGLNFSLISINFNVPVITYLIVLKNNVSMAQRIKLTVCAFLGFLSC